MLSARALYLVVLPALVTALLSTTIAQAQVDSQQQAVPAVSTRDDVAVSVDNLRFEVPENICRFDAEKGPEMVVIPPGQFRMGSDDSALPGDEQPARDVTIDYAFALGRCEVTYAEFQQFADEVSGSLSDAIADGCFTLNEDGTNFERRLDASWKDPQLPVNNLQNYPVVCISIPMVEAYIGWLNDKAGLTDTLQAYRLPTEAELEYALRGGGADSDGWRETEEVCKYANVADQSYAGWLPDKTNTTSFAGCDDDFPTISPVGTYVANPYGLHDLYGNVWEWVADCWHDSYEGAPSDGSAWVDDCTETDWRPLRGGSWGNLPENLRAANRDRYFSGDADIIVGFRLARTLP